MVVDFVVLERLRRGLDAHHRQMLARVVAAFRGAPTVWLTALGLWSTLAAYPMRADLRLAGQRVILIAVLAMATFVAARLAVGLIADFARHHAETRSTTSLFETLAQIAIYALGALIVLQSLGISITPVLTALGVGGLAVALALRDPLANLFAGLQITISRQVKPGDFVRLDNGNEGFVVDITWRNTTIRDLTNNLIVVPNEKLAQSIFTNYHLPDPAYTVHVDVGVHYDSDLEHVEAVTMAVARSLQAEIAGPAAFEPFVRFIAFGDSSINLRVFVRTGQVVDQFRVRHLLIKRLHQSYADAGISIPYPMRTVTIAGGALPQATAELDGASR
ncbi:MAG: mechanosensitive ion channel family protein [Vulcanimicrobiaceae bacterium]